MGIMDMFRSPPSTSSTEGQSQQPTPGKDSLSAPNPVVDATGKIPGTEPLNQNPLDIYSKMFDNAANNSDIQAPTFKLDPKVLGDVSSKMDFTRGINPEVLTKATSGDVSALMDIIKTVGQNAYRTSLEHSTSLTDTFLTQRGEFEGKQVAKGVKNQLTSNELSNAPNYSHPVVKAELNRVAAQMSAANPDASPQEIAKAAQQYINDLSSALNPKASNGSPSDGNGDFDWTKYLTNS
jgi:hypothetical protein